MFDIFFYGHDLSLQLSRLKENPCIVSLQHPIQKDLPLFLKQLEEGDSCDNRIFIQGLYSTENYAFS